MSETDISHKARQYRVPETYNVQEQYCKIFIDMMQQQQSVESESVSVGEPCLMRPTAVKKKPRIILDMVDAAATSLI